VAEYDLAGFPFHPPHRCEARHLKRGRE
jgi:hypothetical protein